ncbi:MAG: cupin domain-containing protein [Nitrososphaeria archaeon]
MTIYKSEDLEVELVKPGAKRTIVVGKELMLVLWNFEPNQTSSPHSHPHEQLLYVIEGDGEFQLGTQKTTLKAGDIVHIPPNESHGFTAIGDNPLTIIDIFHPIREDFLRKEKQ